MNKLMLAVVAGCMSAAVAGAYAAQGSPADTDKAGRAGPGTAAGEMGAAKPTPGSAGAGAGASKGSATTGSSAGAASSGTGATATTGTGGAAASSGSGTDQPRTGRRARASKG
jgi:hypothetical protein